ncbi:uncharacterized protein A1O5_10368 [Cladophialophora psammophila CBS 110553]|uniref:Major facilitator superfamily (MFS) profile domain-containing protein n=1 Tax=Cladophialophora psammophila CBS 110553 TaxID=1182543 RepID=W9WF07_9EURO|nr:uncharacterized protein A1O5_10368 [Cladophialophora psammophila CBS 110553]EXJ66697.1 hypothetical protein A1O5_10368 [Cladophialophora psammophila CBS 110553]
MEDGEDGESEEKLSASMARTIRELERLVDEAVKLAESAGSPHDDGHIAEQPDRNMLSLPRRPQLGLAKKISKYLEDVSTKTSDFVPPSENGQSPKSRPSATEPSFQGDEIKIGEGSLRCRGACSADNLRLLLPEPIAEPLEERKTKLSRDRRSTELPSDLKNPAARFLQPPQIGPRVTSANAIEESSSSASRPIPTLQLNGDRLDVHLDEDREPLLVKPGLGHERHFSQMFGIPSRHVSINMAHPSPYPSYKVDLNGVQHIDLPERADNLAVHTTCHHAPMVRNWPNSRKRLAAVVSCINVTCLGLLLGIYAGEVPAIQYVIVDLDNQVILGNLFLYLGLAIPTMVFWPLPLLHGRKPYTLAALALALCLQIPQGLMVIAFRSPDVSRYRITLLLSRGMSGFVLGFADINNLATMLDIFGASLQSSDSYELGDPYDVRRHGGGMGVWLAIWSWCTVGSISIGFLIGALIISRTSVDWGFWISSLLLMAVILLNLLSPEVRRSAFRRTIAEITGEGGSFSRVARGEVKLHLTGNGPYWWGEEIIAALRMSWRMVKQPGLLVLSIYAAWVYAQFTLVLMLLGALASTEYHYRPDEVGLCVLSLAIGSALAMPFQTASWLSRSRYHPPRTDSMTFQKAMVWQSHTVRRTFFTIFLPLAAIGYALSSRQPPFPIAVPCLFAAFVGFGSNLAIAECYALMMLTFDTSDLQPGMTGRPPRRSVRGRIKEQRTNFSCYPRVSAGMAVTQSLKFVFGAVATGIGGRVERRYGGMQAAGIVAGVLMALTLLLTVVLFRWKSVQMIPGRQDRVVGEGEEEWEPVILGNPTGLTRKINILEAGEYTRWSEIRRRNRLTTRSRGA